MLMRQSPHTPILPTAGQGMGCWRSIVRHVHWLPGRIGISLMHHSAPHCCSSPQMYVPHGYLEIYILATFRLMFLATNDYFIYISIFPSLPCPTVNICHAAPQSRLCPARAY